MNKDFEIKDKTHPNDGIKISPFKKDIRKTQPHKHKSYFEIIYLTAGSGHHTIDTHAHRIKPPIAFTVKKEQIHFWEIESEPSGFVLIIKKQFVERCLDLDLRRLLSDLTAYNVLFPNDNSTAILFELLNVEFEKNGANQNPIFDGLLKALLGNLLASSKNKIKAHKNNLYGQFINSLSQGKLINRVAYYAEILNTTPQNLNAICRKEVDKTAAEVISEHIIGEAKRLLWYTDLSVSEIAHSLQFKDNSHFTKYFKRHLNITPITFRKAER